MNLQQLVLTTSFLLCPALLPGQGGGASPADLLKPLKDSWPTYNGDYTGRRYSALTQANQSTAKPSTLAWCTRVTSGMGAGGGGGRGGRGGFGGSGGGNLIIGGEGPGDIAAGGGS